MTSQQEDMQEAATTRQLRREWRNEEILRLARSEWTAEQIAARFSVTPKTVRLVMRGAGLVADSKGWKGLL